jgi:hypothetical protein
MVKLGVKLSKAFSSLGQKSNKITTKIGDKTNHVVNNVKSVSGVIQKKAGQIQNTTSGALDKTRDLVNQVPDINNKAVNLGNKIINKSGQATNVLRKASGIAGALTNGLADMGSSVPVVGSVLKAGAKATDLLAKGAKRLDGARDNAAYNLDKYADASRGTISEIEKLNSRKRQAAAEAAAQGDGNDGYA